MNKTPPADHHRILVIDDNPAIHDDIRKILVGRGAQSPGLASAKALLFGDVAEESSQDDFAIDSAYQGEEGLRKVQAAADAGQPYALAFVDVRMPPGWDGVETITRIWQKYPDLQVVICTAYSDYSWEDMVRQIGRSSSMVVLKKPFDNIEVLQLAHALTEKWNLNRQVQGQLRDLDRLVDQRTVELLAANEQLKREIAERLQTEKALVLSEERFSKAFRANPIPLAIQSLQRETITDANQGFQTLTGYSREDLVGHSPLELALWVEPEQSRTILEKLRTDPSIRHLPCRLRTHSGAVCDILLSVELIELNGESCLLTIAQDITEQLQLEKQLRHSQKMEAVGQLAAGIAHDFNNMLTVIQGNASLVLADCTDPAERPLLEGIVAAAQRSAKMVRQLLTFSHKQTMEVTSMNVREILAPLAEMLPRMLGEQITVRVDVPPHLPPVAGDSGMVEQMLMNLAVNARDAMPRGGRLTIHAAVADVTAADLRVNQDARPGRFLCLSVTDTGSGIAPDVLPRIFEPFFTTKPVGRGTGLGLATVYGIAKQHGGWIGVASELGRGTTFKVFLPVNAALAPAPVEAPHELTPRARGKETILLVEDEDTVRYCASTILTSHGYTVLTACNGLEALTVWKQNRERIDLLLTDMVMPGGLSGRDVAKRLLVDHPELKVIFTSGYSRDMGGSASPFMAAHRFIAKPYQLSALLRTVRDGLDRPAAGARTPRAVT